MYIKAKSYRSVKFWEKHLQDTIENDRAEIIDSRGLAANDLREMMLEMKEDAEFTRCQNFMYIAIFNPCEDERLSEKEWDKVYEIFEKHRGIPEGQQRIVIEHEKKGRIHRHVVWNRIDAEKSRAFPDEFDLVPCEAAEIEIEQTLGLRRTPNFLDRDPNAPDLKRSPKTWEMLRGMKSGLDARDVTAEVTDIYRNNRENPNDFINALEESGYQFVKGKRAFCILDPVGQEHSLAKRIDGVNTKELKDFLAGVDLSTIPSLEDAKAQFQARRNAEREADSATVAHEIAWEEALAKAAIAAENVKGQGIAQPRREKGKPDELSHRPTNWRDLAAELTAKPTERGLPAQDRPKPFAPKLGKIGGQIRLAYSLTDTGPQFADAIEDRGLIAAVVTEADAERLNKWERQRIKEQWQAPHPRDEWMAQRGGSSVLNPKQHDSAQRSYDKWLEKRDPGNGKTMDFEKYVAFVQARDEAKQLGGPTYQKYRRDEIVIVDQFGGVHQLTVANTGDSFTARAEHLKDIDRAALPSVALAQGAMKEFNQHHRQERQHQWDGIRKDWEQANVEKYWPARPPESEHKSWTAFQKAAADATRDHREEKMSREVWKIWAAWRDSDPFLHQKFEKAIDDATQYGAAAVKTKPRAKVFATAMDDNGISFAIASKDEAARSHMDATFAQAVQNRAPRFKEGEIVIVTEKRPEFRREGQIIIPPRIHKIDPSLAEKFVRTLDNRAELKSIDATIKLSDTRAKSRAAEHLIIGNDRATDLRQRHTIGRLSPFSIGGTALRSFGKVGKALGLFSSFLPQPLSPDQIRAGRKAERRRAAAGEDRKETDARLADLTAERRRLELEHKEEREPPERGRDR